MVYHDPSDPSYSYCSYEDDCGYCDGPCINTGCDNCGHCGDQQGCTDGGACNYNPCAVFGDNSCIFDYGCGCGNPGYDDCGNCGNCFSGCDTCSNCGNYHGGCLDNNACNFDPCANYDDGVSCVYTNVHTGNCDSNYQDQYNNWCINPADLDCCGWCIGGPNVTNCFIDCSGSCANGSNLCPDNNGNLCQCDHLDLLGYCCGDATSDCNGVPFSPSNEDGQMCFDANGTQCYCSSKDYFNTCCGGCYSDCLDETGCYNAGTNCGSCYGNGVSCDNCGNPNGGLGGCTDSGACNYNSCASYDDGSCQYTDCFGNCGGSGFIDACGNCSVCECSFDCAGNPVSQCYYGYEPTGYTDPSGNTCNQNSTDVLGYCCGTCNDAAACGENGSGCLYSDACGACGNYHGGCKDSGASNFDNCANFDNHSCTYGCNDHTARNYHDGSSNPCWYVDCNDPAANNYDQNSFGVSECNYCNKQCNDQHGCYDKPTNCTTCGCPTHCDCMGICEGNLVADCNGTCGGTAVVDCNNVCGGDGYLDPFGYCVSASGAPGYAVGCLDVLNACGENSNGCLYNNPFSNDCSSDHIVSCYEQGYQCTDAYGVCYNVANSCGSDCSITPDVCPSGCDGCGVCIDSGGIATGCCDLTAVNGSSCPNNCDNSLCEYVCDHLHPWLCCSDPDACNYGNGNGVYRYFAQPHPGLPCVYPDNCNRCYFGDNSYGCTDPLACNYDPNASCPFDNYGNLVVCTYDWGFGCHSNTVTFSSSNLYENGVVPTTSEVLGTVGATGILLPASNQILVTTNYQLGNSFNYSGSLLPGTPAHKVILSSILGIPVL